MPRVFSGVERIPIIGDFVRKRPSVTRYWTSSPAHSTGTDRGDQQSPGSEKSVQRPSPPSLGATGQRPLDRQHSRRPRNRMTATDDEVSAAITLPEHTNGDPGNGIQDSAAPNRTPIPRFQTATTHHSSRPHTGHLAENYDGDEAVDAVATALKCPLDDAEWPKVMMKYSGRCWSHPRATHCSSRCADGDVSPVAHSTNRRDRRSAGGSGRRVGGASSTRVWCRLPRALGGT